MPRARVPRNVGTVPTQRATARPPQQRPLARAPHGEAPKARAHAAPQERGVGALPNPRTPKLVRDVNGGALGDLFGIFPDLPRPLRPAARLDRKRTFKGGRL